jgi:RNA polymerase sigma-70 factor (ECF subfamily)
MTNPRQTEASQLANAAFQIFRDRRDPAAIAQVFDLAAPDLRRTAVHLVGDSATADDLVQTTFLCAMESRTFDRSRDVLPWLAGILHNQASLVHRRRARRFDAERLRQQPAEDPSVAASEWETQREVALAIEQLPDVYRPVVSLHLMHGLEAGAIAESLGRPGGTVRTQLMRGLEKLRELLPIGIAGAIAGLLPTMGTAAVRTAVITAAGGAAASASVATSATATSWSSGRLAVAALLLTSAVLAPFAWPSDEVAAPKIVTATASATVHVVPATGIHESQPNQEAVNTVSNDNERQVAVADATLSTFVIRGVVRDDKGAPVRGAEVLSFAENRPLHVGAGFRPSPSATAVTDTDGTYEIVMPGAKCYVIARDAGRFCERAIDGTADRRTEVSGLDFRLVQMATQRGLVVDERGRGRPQLAVTTPLHSIQGTSGSLAVAGFQAAQLPLLATKTDERGAFAVQVVPTELYTYEVVSPTLPYARKEHTQQRGDVKIVSPTGYTLRGTARRSDGKPAANAKVWINADFKALRRTTCDAQGQFELVGLLNGKDLALSIDDEQSAIYCMPVAEVNATVSAHLELPRILSGRLVDAALSPIAGAFVRIVGDRNAGALDFTRWEIAHHCSSTTSGKDGTFAIERLYDGVFTIEVRLPGESEFLKIGLQRAGLPTRDFSVTPAVASTATLRGRAIDALTGAPIGEIHLSVAQRHASGVLVSYPSRVQCKDGVYEKRQLALGDAHISARAEGYASSDDVEMTLTAGVHTLDFRLSPSCILRVRATVDGTPSTAVASVVRMNGKSPTLDVGGLSTSGGQMLNGEVVLREVPREVLRVRVNGTNFEPQEQTVDLRNATDITEVSFELMSKPREEKAQQPTMRLFLFAMLCTDANAERDFGGNYQAEWLRRIESDPRYTVPTSPVTIIVRDASGKQIASARIAPATITDPVTRMPVQGFSTSETHSNGMTVTRTSARPTATLSVPARDAVVEFSCEGRASRRTDVKWLGESMIPVAAALAPAK